MNWPPSGPCIYPAASAKSGIRVPVQGKGKSQTQDHFQILHEGSHYYSYCPGCAHVHSTAMFCNVIQWNLPVPYCRSLSGNLENRVPGFYCVIRESVSELVLLKW